MLVLAAALFISAVAVFLFLLPVKLLVIVAKTAQPDIRDEVVADAMKWYGFAKVVAIILPIVFFLFVGIFMAELDG